MNLPDDWTNTLAKRLREPLPHYEAHKAMAPEGRFPKENIHHFQPNATTKLSAVLIAFYEREGKLYFPLIVRPEHTGVHSGQVALPGGKKDAEDTDLVATALREMEEEMGVAVSRESIIGELSHFYIPPSNFLIYPILAYLPEAPKFAPNPQEVTRLLEIDLCDFVYGDNRKEKVIQASYMKGNMPYYDLQQHTVWGATAMILSELQYIWLEIFES